MKIYTVYDTKARYGEKPFTLPTDVHAYRAFQSEINRPSQDNNLYMHYKDFELRYIGEFDPDTGTIVSAEPTVIATGEAVKAKDGLDD